MNRLRKVTRLTLVSVFLALVAIPGSAQVQNGGITGDVTDPSGAAVPSVKVTAINPQTGLTLNATANQTGHFVINQVPIGTYRLTVSAPGFKSYARADVPVNAGSIQHLDIKLQVGQVTETVEVTGAPPSIDVETSRLAQVVTGTQVANLPLNGRNVYNLIQLAPGAVNVAGVLSENGAGTVVNGLRENFNGFLINGVSNKGLSGGTVTTPIQDTVQEFQELTLNMSAQYGNSAGSITNLVTKSGTNDVHGSAWWFVRNDIFDANNFFLNHEGIDKQPLRFNQYGAAVGGPIVKNKLFIFGSFQGDRFREAGPPTPVQVESPAFRAAVIQAFPNSTAALLYKNFPPSVQGTPALTLNDYVTGSGGGAFSGSGFSTFGDYLCPDNSSPAIAASFATLMGVTAQDQADMAAAGCGTIPAIRAGAFDRNAPFLFDTAAFNGTQNEQFAGINGYLFNGWELSGRIDYNPTDKDRMFGQMNWVRANDKFGFPNTVSNSNGRGPAFLNPARAKYPNFQFSYVHTFTPKLLNEFRAGYVGNIGPDVKVAEAGVPDLRFDDGSMGFGSYNGYPQTFHENIYSYSDMVTISHGKHNLKVGADVRRNIENSDFNVARPSYYFFDPLFFAADAPYTQTAGVDPGIISAQPAHLSSNNRHWRNWEVGAYFQDDWKVTPRLTLNLGIRYDLFQRHHELNNLVTTFLLGPGNNFIDNITTGAGQIKDASFPLGSPECPSPERLGNSGVAGVCGPGGFATAKSLGKGDHNNFGPRVGFALDVFGNGKTSLRGGFGVSYEGTLYNPLSNSRWNLPYYSFNSATNFLAGDVQNVVYGPTICDPICRRDPNAAPTFTGPPTNPNQGTGAQAVGNLTGWDPSNQNLSFLSGIIFPQGVRDPYVYNYFLGLQHEVAANTVVEVDYVGTTGHKIFRAENVNRIAGAWLPEGSCATDNFGRRLCSQFSDLNPFGRLNPNYGTMRVWANNVNSNYNALQASVRRQLSAGVSFTVNYTWSHALDGGSTWHSGATSSNGPAAGEGYTTDPTLKNVDRGNAIFDVRHRIVANYVWELPWLKNQQGFIGHVLGGWQWNGIFSYQTGAHWSAFDRRFSNLVNSAGNDCTAADIAAQDCVNTGGDYNLDGERNDRPNAVANNFDPSHNQWADGWGGVFAPGGGFFTAPCLTCVSNLQRNTFVGPSFWNFDTSLFKNIKVTERVNMQFRVETFNLFNHTNFQLPGASGSTNNRVNQSNFGQAGGVFAPRQMQFGLKLNF